VPRLPPNHSPAGPESSGQPQGPLGSLPPLDGRRPYGPSPGAPLPALGSTMSAGPKRSGSGRLVAVVLLVVAVVGVGAFVLSRRGGDDGGPVQAVHDLADAANNRDCQGMVDASTDNLLNSYFDAPGVDVTPENFLERCRQLVTSAAWPRVTIEGTEIVSQDGDTAVVEVTEYSHGSSATHQATVMNVDGHWKIDSVTFNGTGGGSNDPDAPGSATAQIPDGADSTSGGGGSGGSDSPGSATAQVPGGSGGATTLDQSALDNCSLSTDDLGTLPPGDYETYIDQCGFPSD
jgi:hypothetical protein